jgi:NAD(P)-dependent dehydrogenase (short-subunit alcohol dehydrogenase family)
MTDDEWRRLFDTNVTGVFNATRAALPHLRARGGGWIVNVSSLSATAPFANGAAYCATKAAVDAFTEALMQEVRHDGIRVASVAPGSVDTTFGGGGRDKSSWALQPADVAQVDRGPDGRTPGAAFRAASKSARHNRRERLTVSVFDKHREQLELHETMMGASRGRLAVALDLLTDAWRWWGSTASTVRARGCPASRRWTSRS